MITSLGYTVKPCLKKEKRGTSMRTTVPPSLTLQRCFGASGSGDTVVMGNFLKRVLRVKGCTRAELKTRSPLHQ